MKEFDSAELAQFNGENGKPIYIAHAGKVYDVSESKLWRNGVHMKRHGAGRDLSADIQAAPHESDVLERFPQVGILKKEVVEQELPGVLDWLLKKYPFLRRHPHPMTVHFPIVFAFSATVFTLLFVITGEPSFDTTAFHCLAGGVVFTIVGIVTGLYTWWLNYMAKMLHPVKIKIPLTIAMLIVEIVLFVWRLTVPDVLYSLQGSGLIYLLLALSLSIMVTIIGWNGAAMTFPVEHD
ncbi:MAG: cytochrome b5 [Deltaproteobacteria bacterium]|jgi:predicted heme/steroid binding protein/uncharacterized membrane protein|nr:cytochrome b5 [Deltaproteobacteria bacterium]